ncbi:MAG: hypothetical protein ACO2PK_06900, partial [Armatimonadota bacterium]
MFGERQRVERQRIANGEWRVEQQRIANSEWRMVGRQRMANSQWRIANRQSPVAAASVPAAALSR